MYIHGLAIVAAKKPHLNKTYCWTSHLKRGYVSYLWLARVFRRSCSINPFFSFILFGFPRWILASIDCPIFAYRSMITKCYFMLALFPLSVSDKCCHRAVLRVCDSLFTDAIIKLWALLFAIRKSASVVFRTFDCFPNSLWTSLNFP